MSRRISDDEQLYEVYQELLAELPLFDYHALLATAGRQQQGFYVRPVSALEGYRRIGSLALQQGDMLEGDIDLQSTFATGFVHCFRYAQIRKASVELLNCWSDRTGDLGCRDAVAMLYTWLADSARSSGFALHQLGAEQEVAHELAYSSAEATEIAVNDGQYACHHVLATADKPPRRFDVSVGLHHADHGAATWDRIFRSHAQRARAGLVLAVVPLAELRVPWLGAAASPDRRVFQLEDYGATWSRTLRQLAAQAQTWEVHFVAVFAEQPRATLRHVASWANEREWSL